MSIISEENRSNETDSEVTLVGLSVVRRPHPPTPTTSFLIKFANCPAHDSGTGSYCCSSIVKCLTGWEIRAGKRGISAAVTSIISNERGNEMLRYQSIGFQRRTTRGEGLD